MATVPSGFSEVLKQHLASWRERDERFKTDGVHSWVLHHSAAALNYFGAEEWHALVAGKLHRWGHALNSSQAFAVNLFAPARFSGDVAHALWTKMPAGASHPDPQCVNVHFEYSGPDDGFAKQALGETGVATQIDVAVEASCADKSRHFQFIEVKLGESRFGACRGARTGKKRVNPTPERCQDLTQVRKDPGSQCWLANSERRRYWELIEGQSGLAVLADDAGGCPWRGGLYQLMRNWALARALVEHGIAASVELAVCVHPGNHEARRLDRAVSGTNDVVHAFNSMTDATRVSELDPRALLAVQDVSGAPSGWRTYMKGRYLLS